MGFMSLRKTQVQRETIPMVTTNKQTAILLAKKELTQAHLIHRSQRGATKGLRNHGMKVILQRMTRTALVAVSLTISVRTFTGHLQDIYRTFTGHLQDIYRTFTGHLQDVYRTFTGHLQDICRTFAGHLQDICRTFAGQCHQYTCNTSFSLSSLCLFFFLFA
jgi:hypothetical protein